MKLLPLIFSLLLLFTIGCEKNVIDYRNKYVGNWMIQYNSYSWMMGSPSTSSDGIYQNAVIRYEKSTDDLIIIEFDNTFSLELSINDVGELTGCGASGLFIGADQLELSTSSSACNYALGGGSSSSYIGVKI